MGLHIMLDTFWGKKQMHQNIQYDNDYPKFSKIKKDIRVSEKNMFVLQQQ